MAQTEAQRKAKQKYDAKNYKTIGIKCPIEEYNVISSIAKNNNQTTSMFSRECLKYYIERYYDIYLSIQSSQKDNLSYNDISKKLFDLRDKNNFSPSFVANEFDIKRAEYDEYESGVEPVPLNILLKACKLYDISMSYFNIDSNLTAVGNKGYTIENSDTSDVLEVTSEEFEMLKKVLDAYRNK